MFGEFAMYQVPQEGGTALGTAKANGHVDACPH
jgi:hypothetical protein